MSSLERLSIQGIRSFSPNNIEEIKFQTPLTLIVGANGAGKTTIIECLKYATTGDMPPISKGNGFVTDPQFYNVTTVNAMVKLYFKDLKNRLVITRNSSLTLDPNSHKLNYKTTTKTLEVQDLQTNQTITHEPSKTVAIEDILSKYVGVSKPILDYVIFSHQEDSLWPLSDSNTLKKRFDEIFEVSRFTKELQHLNHVKKGVRVDIKIRENDLTNSQKNLQKAQVIHNRINELKGKLELYTYEKDQLVVKLKEIEQSQHNLMTTNESYVSIINEYERLKAAKETLIKNLQQMVSACPRILKKEPLVYLEAEQERLKSLSEQLSYDVNETYVSHLENLNLDYEKLLSMLNELNVEKGAFLQAKNTYNTHKLEVDQLIKDFQVNHSDLKVSSPQDLKKIIEQKKFDLEALKKEFKLEIDKFQTDINMLKNDIHVYESKNSYSLTMSDNLKDEVTILEKKITSISNHELIKHGDNIESLEISKKRLLNTLETECSSSVIADIDRMLETNSHKIYLLDEELKDIRDKILASKESSKSSTLYTFKRKQFTNRFSKFEKMCFELIELFSQSNDQFSIKNSKNLKVIFTSLFDKSLDELINASECFSSNYNISWLEFLKGLEETKAKLASDLDKNQATINEDKEEITELKNQIKQSEKRYSAIETESAKLEIKIFTVMNILDYKYDGSSNNFKEGFISKLKSDFEEYFETVKQNLKESSEALNYHTSIIKVYGHIRKGILKKNCCSICNTSFSQEPEKLNTVVDYLDSKINTDINSLEKEQMFCQKEYNDYKAIEESIESFISLNIEASNVETELADYKGKLKISTDSQMEKFIEQKQTEDKVKIVDKINERVSVLKNEMLEVEETFKDLVDTAASIKNQSHDMNLDTTDVSLLAEKQDAKESEKQNLSETISGLNKKRFDILSLKKNISADIQKVDYNIATVKRLLNEVSENKDQLEKKQQKLNDEMNNVAKFSDIIKEKKVALSSLEMRYNDYETKTKTKIKASEAIFQSFQEKWSRLNSYLLPEIAKFEKLYSNTFENISEKVISLEEKIQLKNNDINKQRNLISNGKEKLGLLKDELSEIKICIQHHEQKKELNLNLNKLSKINQKEVSDYRKEYAITSKELNNAFTEISSDISCKKGEIKQIELQINTDKETLDRDYKNIEEQFHKINCNSKTLLNIEHDLEIAIKVIETSIMEFHKTKMEEINVLLDELWRTTYKGSDIATIKIVTEKVTKTQGVESYNYKVVMYKDSLEIDMRGRCSAGQKVMACVLIRLALAETFGVACGVITLDEPTTNLDEENSEGLAESLHRIIESRRFQQNFQIVIITHDESFLRFMNAQDFTDGFWRVYKDNNLASKIEWVEIDKLIH